MSEVATFAPGKIVWIDLATKDLDAAEKFYGGLFGWEREVNDDPQYGGYGFFKSGGRIVAGVGPVQSAEQPVVWQAYIGSGDSDATARKVENAGGKVIAPPFDVGNQGRMAVFQDPGGAFISVWQAGPMGGIQVTDEPNSLGWVELQAQDLGPAKPFYKEVFGWDAKTTDVGGGNTYTEWQLDGTSIAGGMQGMAPFSFWLVYFQASDVDAATRRAEELGATVVVPAQDYPGGRFSVVTDPQGAWFGLVSG